MKLPGDCLEYGLSPHAPYANPFHQVETLDLANMRGVQCRGPSHVVDLVRGYSHLAASNLVDRGLGVGDRIRRSLVKEIYSLILPESSGLCDGIVESTGSHSNEKALRLVRRVTGRSKIVCSSLTHGSIVDAARDSGMPLSVIPVDSETMQMKESDLLDVLDEETAVLVLTAGSTYLGRVETLPRSVESRLKESGIRLHVDAAYGGLNVGLQNPETSGRADFDRLVGSDAISSMTVDVHKFSGPMGCSVLLLNASDIDQAGREESYLSRASWLSGTTQGSFVPYMALRTLQRLGHERLRDYADRNLRSAQCLEDALRARGVTTLSPVSSGVVAARCTSAQTAQSLYDALTHVGFNIPKPFKIETTAGPVYGVRFVLTPEVYHDYLYLTEELAPMIADATRFSEL